ncbi:unnamed protein product, partial [marine sediment metagenome]
LEIFSSLQIDSLIKLIKDKGKKSDKEKLEQILKSFVKEDDFTRFLRHARSTLSRTFYLNIYLDILFLIYNDINTKNQIKNELEHISNKIGYFTNFLFKKNLINIEKNGTFSINFN